MQALLLFVFFYRKEMFSNGMPYKSHKAVSFDALGEVLPSSQLISVPLLIPIAFAASVWLMSLLTRAAFKEILSI